MWILTKRNCSDARISYYSSHFMMAWLKSPIENYKTSLMYGLIHEMQRFTQVSYLTSFFFPFRNQDNPRRHLKPNGSNIITLTIINTISNILIVNKCEQSQVIYNELFLIWFGSKLLWDAINSNYSAEYLHPNLWDFWLCKPNHFQWTRVWKSEQICN